MNSYCNVSSGESPSLHEIDMEAIRSRRNSICSTYCHCHIGCAFRTARVCYINFTAKIIFSTLRIPAKPISDDATNPNTFTKI
ncbi:hypothetical protein BC936DRAFT_137134 [Jimgerdemannia flammicorona]|uniref:Uncharacterized protein n=1 Tax=Jimgerdemannia flammicorona TaxID=994334 RepID=A0A433CXZ1_9FUNG|nr:hypothetical protein BC936DRAFT_137134 [Jimgerdemannia flammicorona]